MAPADAAHRHRRAAERFGRTVLGVADWSVPTPVPQWRARDVVAHLTGWLPPFLASAGGPALSDAHADAIADPVPAWLSQAAAVQRLLEDPDHRATALTDPYLGTMLLAEAIDRFYTTDVVLHTWDLARATGQDDRLDPDWCADVLAGMEPMEDAIRGSGHYGPRVAVSADADAQTRLLGFIGRDPAWQPPG